MIIGKNIWWEGKITFQCFCVPCKLLHFPKKLCVYSQTHWSIIFLSITFFYFFIKKKCTQIQNFCKWTQFFFFSKVVWTQTKVLWVDAKVSLRNAEGLRANTKFHEWMQKFVCGKKKLLWAFLCGTQNFFANAKVLRTGTKVTFTGEHETFASKPIFPNFVN